MPIGAAARFFRSGRVVVTAQRTQWWDTRKSAAVDIGSGYGVSVDNGDLITNVRNQVATGATLTQATGADKPTVDLVTIPGALLVKTLADDHMTASVSGQLLTIAMVFRDDGASAERHLLSRDTNAVTNKAAFEISIIVE